MSITGLSIIVLLLAVTNIIQTAWLYKLERKLNDIAEDL